MAEEKSQVKEVKMKPIVITEESEKFLQDYLNNFSPTGFEANGQKKWLEYLKPYIDDYIVDSYGNVAAIINPEKEFKVIIEAHADEISWFVSYIAKDGYLSVVRNGGSDHMIAPSMRVAIHGRNGLVDGIFGWPAIHLRNGKTEDKPTITNITIDVGCSTKEEVLALGIHVGSVVPFSLYVVNAVQEEVGLRGAQMIVETIKPHLAIVTDVCHDTNTPGIAVKEFGDFKCGSGPVITYGPSIHHILRDLIIQVAEVEDIPYQLDAVSRVTGTDADAFAYANGGIPTALISIPLRYMHTTVETASKSDVNQVIHLIYETLKTIDPNKSFKYFS
jgi:putative aminopeptidase FrvX